MRINLSIPENGSLMLEVLACYIIQAKIKAIFLFPKTPVSVFFIGTVGRGPRFWQQ